jgi:hypothetical protein
MLGAGRAAPAGRPGEPSTGPVAATVAAQGLRAHQWSDPPAHPGSGTVTGVDCTECTAQATVQRPRNITRRSLLTDTDTKWKFKRIQALRLTHKRARMHTHMQAQTRASTETRTDGHVVRVASLA